MNARGPFDAVIADSFGDVVPRVAERLLVNKPSALSSSAVQTASMWTMLRGCSVLGVEMKNFACELVVKILDPLVLGVFALWSGTQEIRC